MWESNYFFTWGAAIMIMIIMIPMVAVMVSAIHQLLRSQSALLAAANLANHRGHESGEVDAGGRCDQTSRQDPRTDWVQRGDGRRR